MLYVSVNSTFELVRHMVATCADRKAAWAGRHRNVVDVQKGYTKRGRGPKLNATQQE